MRTMMIVMCEALAISIIYLGVTSLGKKKARVVDDDNIGGHDDDHDDEDFISQLPDDILISIIDRTPTPSVAVVRTSVLSKRWKNLYKSVSEFDLQCSDLLSRDTYSPSPHAGAVIYSLERFLNLCSASGSRIHSFTIVSCLTDSDRNGFQHCISYLGKLGVEKLVLSLSCTSTHKHSRVSFPYELISETPSLKDLTLFHCSLQSSIKSKCYFLQTLFLVEVTLLPGSLECILSNCLSLHSLTIFCCSCPPKLSVHGPPSLQLKTLNVECCSALTEIELCATNLTTFKCSNYRMVNLIFDHVPQLETMYISFFGVGINMMPYVFGEFPKSLPHIKSLNLTNSGGFGQESVLMAMETFGNLRRLEICVGCMARTDLMALTPYLESCPLLEELLLNLANMQYKVVVERKAAIVVHRKLMKVELSGFVGVDNEIEFASYILKTAVALDQMLIIGCLKVYTQDRGCVWYPKKPWSGKTRKNIEQSLQHQARSNSAKLIIRHQL